MDGILWASLGAAIGMAAPLLFRLWQRSAADRADTPPTATAAYPRLRGPAETQTRPATGTTPPAGLNRKQTRKFHGISVKPGPHACQAVQALVGRRFLPDEAPAMPLATCDRSKCQCAYSHHGDRRDREDRRSGWGTFGGFTPSIPGGNRRAKSMDRRATRK